MENLYEESLNPKNIKFQKVLYVICVSFKIVDIVLAAFFLYVGLMMDIAMLIIGALFVLFAIFIHFLQTNIYYCVDCIFVSGSTRLVKVVNYKRRKKIIIFDAKEVLQVGKTGSDSFYRLYADKNNKKILASPNKLYDDAFYVFISQNDTKYLIILDCTETYLSHLITFTGKKVIEKDYK